MLNTSQIASAIGTGHLLAPLAQIVARYASPCRYERFEKLIVDLIASDEEIVLAAKKRSITTKFDIGRDGINLTFYDEGVTPSTLAWRQIIFDSMRCLYDRIMNMKVTPAISMMYGNYYGTLHRPTFQQSIEEILLLRIGVNVVKK